MAKRRPSGDGMVRKRDDGRWEARIVVGHKENGDSIFHYMSAKTQKALMEKLHRSIDEYDGAELTEQSRMTLGEWLEIWLEECATPAVRPNTLKNYRRYVANNIKPYLGDKQICKVTTADVQSLYRKLQREGSAEGGPLAGTTVRRIHDVLHQALDVAVNRHLIVKNPSNDVTLPKKVTTPKTILNDEQLERFMEVIKADEYWHDFFYLEITTACAVVNCAGSCGRTSMRRKELSPFAEPCTTRRAAGIMWATPKPELAAEPSNCRPARCSFSQNGKRSPSLNGYSQTPFAQKTRSYPTAVTHG